MAVLLSIKPEYTEKIFSGEKKFEFRKQKPKSPVTKVFIYESSPSKRIVGWFSIVRVHSGSPEIIWEKCNHSSGIEEERFFRYCKGKTVVFALEIGKTCQFSDPIDPYKDNSNFKPPQNFVYFDESMKLF